MNMKRRNLIQSAAAAVLSKVCLLSAVQRAHASTLASEKAKADADVTIDWKYDNPQPQFISCKGDLKTGKVTVVVEFHYKKLKGYEQRQELNIGIVVNSLSEARYDDEEGKEIPITTGGINQGEGPMLEPELAFGKIKLDSKAKLFFGFDNVPRDAKKLSMNVGIAPDTKSWRFMIVRSMTIDWGA